MLKKLAALLFFLIFTLSFIPQVLAHGEEFPHGFSKSVVAQGLNFPDAVVESPDGRIFVLEKTGAIRIVKNNTLLSTPMMTLPVDTNQEHGLLGITFDSNFSSNHYIYLFYVNKSPNELRISRFTTEGDSASPSSEKILLKSNQPLNPYHIGGTVRFGPDGKLWISVGNNSVNSNSQDLSNIFGKILRINPDGSIPTDNPFYGLNGRETSIWAYGFRNPYRFSFVGSRPIVGDVGEATFEEVNIVSKGGNYGWPVCEGKCDDSSYVNPIFTYSHGGTSAAIVGGFIYKGTSFPTPYRNAYFYADYTRSFIRFLSTDENGNFVDDNEFTDHADIVVDLMQSQDGSLYYVSFADHTFGPGTGTLYKVSYNATDLAPNAIAKADPIAGQSPLKVNFSSKESSDPADLPLTYSWDFGDGATSNEANPVHTYTQNGTYNAKLTVNNGTKTAQDTVKITVGKDLPQPTIIEPALETSYNAGQKVQFSGSATDTADGDLPASAFSWSVLFHHQTHIHPFINEIKGVKSGDFTIPDTGEESHEVSYEIILTVTNSSGLSKTVSRTIYPNVVDLSFTTVLDANLSINVNGIPHEAPFVLKSVVGFKHSLSVPDLQTKDGFNYSFLSWSDGGAKTHTITTPSQNKSYSATFTKSGSGNGHIHFRVREIDANGNWNGKFINGATAKLTDSSGSVVYDTQTSKTIDNQEGWVYFDNIPAGVYGALSYKEGKTGGWRQTTCQGAGTTEAASISNKNTGNFKAAWQTNISVVANQVTWCVDEGLKGAENGELALRVALIEDDPFQPGKYISLQHINGATVKLTDVTGTNVIQTQTTADNPSGEDGWIKFKDIPAGTYGIMAYKPGFSGYWRMISCAGDYETNATIQNSASENNKAAWNNNVTVVGGVTTYCYDLGLRGYGHLHFRVREIDSNGNWTGKFINGATAKLTDKTGNTVYKTETSKTINNEEGWVYFDDLQAGYYGALAYKEGNNGAWRQTDCNSGGTVTNVTIKNSNTEDQTAAWQGDLHVPSAGKILWCSDLGLTHSDAKGTGHVHIRIREINQDGSFSGSFINGATVKLTDTTGNTVVQTQTSKTMNNQEGWVYFDFVPAGDYAILSYKDGFIGNWRQTDCDTGSTTTNASIQNENTEGHTAAWRNDVTIEANQVTWCKDEGLKVAQNINSDSEGSPSAALKVSPTLGVEPSATPTSQVTPTLQPTQPVATPMPTSSPAPTEVPQSTPTPNPTEAPAPTQHPTDQPSPDPTGTPQDIDISN